MAALDATQAAKFIVYCYASTGVTESKGGVSWTKGVIGTGIGTPALPYVDLDEAVQAVRTFEGQENITQNYEFRLVTDPAETTDYGTIAHNSDANFPCVEDTFFFTYKGWLKTWGDPVYGAIGGVWALHADKPTFGQYLRTVTTNDHGPKRQIWKDIKFVNNTSASPDIEWRTDDFADWYIRFIGCDFTGSSSRAGRIELRPTNASGPVPNAAYFSCLFFDVIVDISTFPGIFGGTGSALVSMVNCYFRNTTKNILQFHYQVGGGQIQKRFNVLNCLFNLDGNNLLCYNNAGNTDQKSYDKRDSNRYWLRGGADWGKFLTSGSVEETFNPSALGDDFSSQGDPDIVSDANPVLNVTSLIVDKGSLADDLQFNGDDLSGNNYHLYDALNQFWADSVTNNTPDSSEGFAKFSQRSVGPFQAPDFLVQPAGEIASPINVVTFSPTHVAAKVPLDPDLAGTSQVRFIQAAEEALLTELVYVDSWPLNVTANDNKIDFSEDGGGELTATIPVGIYSTAELMAEIKTQMEAAGAGDYTVTYSDTTNFVTIAVSGAIAAVQLLFATGTNLSSSAAFWIGFIISDGASQASQVASESTLENFYESAGVYEYSEDYDGVSNPTTSGTWFAMGTGDPNDSGVQGTDGVDADDGDRWVRINMEALHPMDNQFHSAQFLNGVLQSSPVAPPND